MRSARIGSGIDPTIRLTTAAANRAYIASADDSPGLLTDARLTAVLPADGDYVVELSDSRYQGASRPVYRLVDRRRADGRGGLSAGRPGRRDGRPGTTRRDARRGQDRRGHLESAVRDRPGRAANLERDAGPGCGTAGTPDLDVESLAPLVVSTYPEIREAADPAAPPPRAVAPVVLQRPDRPARRRRSRSSWR